MYLNVLPSMQMFTVSYVHLKTSTVVPFQRIKNILDYAKLAKESLESMWYGTKGIRWTYGSALF